MSMLEVKGTVEGKIVYFEKVGRENTEEVFRIARRRAEELGIKTIVVASTGGDAGVRAAEVFEGMKVIVVSHHTGFQEPDVQQLTEEHKQRIESKGGVVLTAMHAFAGVSRAQRLKFGTIAVGELVAEVLRIFGQGTKVACEISLMAADAGLVRTDEDIIAIAGSGRGADTALVLKPVNSTKVFDLRVKEILCKPRFTVAPAPQSRPPAAVAEGHHHH